MTRLKNVLSAVFTLSLMLFCVGVVFAQDSVTVNGAGGSLAFAIPAWAKVVGGVVITLYEIIARLVPTTKNISILGWVIKAIQVIVPNNNATVPANPHP